MKLPTAFFVNLPFTIRDLRRLHPIDQRRPYIIEATVTLAPIDYENFSEDLTQWRQFIEDHMRQCYVDKDGVWHCILVQQRGHADGILVMTEGEEWPKWAAYYSPDTADI